MADSLLIYGDPGSGKTTQLGYLAEYGYEKTGKASLLFSQDSHWQPIQPYIDMGIIKAIDVSKIEDRSILYVWRKLSKGYLVNKGGLKSIDQKKYWGVFIEGLTSISDSLTFILGNDKDLYGIAPEEFKGGISEEDENFRSNSRGHVNYVQMFVRDLVSRFNSWENDMVVYTGHIGRGEDTQRTAKYGVKLAGEAKNITILKDIAEVIHIDVREIKKREGEGGKVSKKEAFLAYFRDHPDKVTGIEYKAKSKTPISIKGLVEERWPSGFIVLTEESGLDQYYRFIDSVRERGEKVIVDRLAELKKRMGGSD